LNRRLGLAAVLFVVLLAPATAHAAYDPVGAGTTTISLAKPFARALASQGVKIRVKEGRRRGSRLTLAAAGGKVDPRLGIGAVENNGAIVFSSGRRKVILREVLFESKRSPLYAKVGGGKLKLASGARLTSVRNGFGTDFDASKLSLTAKFATRLNKKLGLRSALSPGEWLGSVHVVSQPTTVHLRPGSRLYLAVDPSFAAKLDKLFVSLNPIAPAELSAGPKLSFPVGPESVLAPDAGSGVLKLEGQAELLQLGSAQMFWREIWLDAGGASFLVETDVEPAPPHPGVAPQGSLLALPPGGKVEADPQAGTISIGGRSVTLTSTAAALLNGAFSPGEPVFAEGQAVGSMSLAVEAE
jgi:hypothetical protein